jgi:EAL domain-containing protein (putative c-di-GMP-specific phosphodiesterase class I)
MYAAKRNGKSRVERFDATADAELVEQFERTAPVNDEAERVTWFARAEEQRAEIELVLEDPARRIAQVFQPIVDLRTGLVSGYEALSRFEGSRRPPNAWFAQAHRCGLGIELEMAAAEAQLEAPHRPDGTRLSINLSPSALLSAEAEERLAGDLSHLILEVTEDELVAEGGALEERIRELRRRGARLAVDDIGAGYAGLKQVMRLQPDVLKLDRSLVAGLASDPAKGAMVDALVRYARRIDSEVCAEGVETLEDLEALADLDVTYGQGYVLARPAPAWAAVDPAAVAVCRSALGAVIRHDESADRAATTSELHLERVCHQIGTVSSRAGLRAVLGPIGELLNVSEIVLSLVTADATRLETIVGNGDDQDEFFSLSDYPATAAVIVSGEAMQVLASDPGADPAELRLMREMGYQSLLMVPLLAGARTTGVLEAYAVADRPWSRTQIHCARILGYQLAHVLDRARLSRPGRSGPRASRRRARCCSSRARRARRLCLAAVAPSCRSRGRPRARRARSSSSGSRARRNRRSPIRRSHARSSADRRSRVTGGSSSRAHRSRGPPVPRARAAVAAQAVSAMRAGAHRCWPNVRRRRHHWSGVAAEW